MALSSSSLARMHSPSTVRLGSRAASTSSVRPALDHAARLLAALEAFGFPVTDLSPEAISDRRRMLQMGVPPVQIHVMSAISGVEWDEAWSDRVEGPLGSNRVQFLGRETFLRNKRAAGRLEDLADIDALEPGRDA
jgi:hypothetical protein